VSLAAAARLLVAALWTCAALAVSDGAGAETPFITVASTTSTEQSGLFAYLLPIYQQRAGVEVRVVAVGTGQALKIGERGDADVVFVHDTDSELAFIAAGFGVDRRPVMYNDFVLVGPAGDPAKVGGGKDAAAAFARIAEAKAPSSPAGTTAAPTRQGVRTAIYGDEQSRQVTEQGLNNTVP
jgi:tungstate transport system substrate-binding protein